MLFIDHNQAGVGMGDGRSAAEEHLALLKFYNFTLNQRGQQRDEREREERHKSENGTRTSNFNPVWERIKRSSTYATLVCVCVRVYGRVVDTRHQNKSRQGFDTGCGASFNPKRNKYAVAGTRVGCPLLRLFFLSFFRS